MTLLDRHSGLIRNVKVTAGQWILQENSSDDDTWMLGAQGQIQFALNEKSKLTVHMADYTFRDANNIARAKNSSNRSLLITNSVRVGGSVVGGRPVDSGGITGYDGDFNIINWGAQLDLETPSEQWPVSFFADFAYNSEAGTNNNFGTWTGFSIGKQSNKGDIRFKYTYRFVETDAILSVIGNDDFGRFGGTNGMGHRIGLAYLLLPNLTFSVDNSFVNFINRPTGFRNPTQHNTTPSSGGCSVEILAFPRDQASLSRLIGAGFWNLLPPFPTPICLTIGLLLSCLLPALIPKVWEKIRQFRHFRERQRRNG